MRFAIHRPYHWVAAASLAGVSFLAGCGGGAETPAPVANNPAPAVTPMPNNPQAMMMAQHGQHGGAMAMPGSMPPGMSTPQGAAAHGAASPPANDSSAMSSSAAAHVAGNAVPNAAAVPNPAAAHAGGTANPAAISAAHTGGLANPNAAVAATNPAAAHAGGTANPNNSSSAVAQPPAAQAAAGTIPGQSSPAAHVAPMPMPAGPNPGLAHVPPNSGAAAAPAAPGAGFVPPMPNGSTPADGIPANAGAANIGNLGAAPGAAAAGNLQGSATGGASTVTGEPGSIEYVISKLVAMAKSGDYTGVESIISEKAKGLAADFRTQDLKPTQIESYKTTFDGMQGLNRRAAGGNGVQFTFKKGETTIQITLAKEAGGVFKIKEMNIRDGKIK